MSTLDRSIAHAGPKARVKAPAPGLRAMLIAAGLAVVGAGLLQVVQTSNVTSTGYHIQRLEEARLEWGARVHQLEAEVASLASLERVEREAQGRLGLVPAERRLYLDVNAPVPAQQLLPTRFAPAEQLEQSSNGSWWQDLLDLVPFF